MATSIAYPADPITQGATAIQATTFDPVSADYTQISWSAAQNLMRGKGQKVRDFPTGAENPAWTFFARNDLAGATATLRNLLGVHVSSVVSNSNVYSTSVGQQIVVPITEFHVKAVNWHCYQLTLTDGTKITRVVPMTTEIAIPVDPETSQLMYNDGTWRSLYEALGCLLQQAAASNPTIVPAINAIAGVNPLT